jgi:hypothetical protein
MYWWYSWNTENGVKVFEALVSVFVNSGEVKEGS